MRIMTLPWHPISPEVSPAGVKIFLE